MDVELQKEVQDVIERLRKLSVEDIDFNEMDPIIKMMLVALINETHSIKDEIKNTPQKIVDRYCSDFIPRDKVEAMPAIALIQPTFKRDKGADIITVDTGVSFLYKSDVGKRSLNYVPLLKTSLFPHSTLYVLTHNTLSCNNEKRSINMEVTNSIWLGIATNVEIECIKGLSILIKGNQGISPEHIFIGSEGREIDFATMNEIERIEMLEPFDAQQSSGVFFAIVNQWKEILTNMEDASLIYLTDTILDRDLFKPRPYPRIFQQWLEDNILDYFDPNTLWIQIDFPEGYTVPDSCDICINVLPVVNVDVNNITLTPASPIAKLQKQDDSFFLKVLETSSSSQKQGFGSMTDDIVICDYDARCYNNGDLYRDIRNLYNKFVDNYYAFIEYNGIKDGEVLKHLRETINKLGKGVGEKNSKFKFDSGTYVMKNMNQYPPASSVKVSFATTQGKIGNEPKIGKTMDCKKMPSVDTKVNVVVSAEGGTDKATADERYELLRYYSLTNDRLYTKMDIDAFLRKEIIAEFGKEEFKRIFTKISIEGAGGPATLVRGLYIDIEFKDKKNYEQAVIHSLDKQMKQRIENKSCIAMPIVVKLVNMEK